MAKILVIEDDIGICRGWQRALRGHALTVAHSGEAAIAAIETQKEEVFDIILSDYNINGQLNGIDVYLYATTRHQEYVQRYIFCTDAMEARLFAFEERISFFEKPFNIMEVKSEIERKLSRFAFMDKEETVPFAAVQF